jgi:hypothetical protein
VPNYHAFRKDNVHDNGGGLLCFIRSDIPSHIEDFDTYPCENLVVIAHIDNEKWALIGTYRKPSIPQRVINEQLDPVIDRCLAITNNVVVLGDLNCDMKKSGANSVLTLCDDLNLTNVVTKPTCCKADTPTLLDVILVNNEKRVKLCDVFPCSLSDFHHFIVIVLDTTLLRLGTKRVSHRSYKHFNEEHFRRDLEIVPFHAGECLDPDDQCHFFTKLFKFWINMHPSKAK